MGKQIQGKLWHLWFKLLGGWRNQGSTTYILSVVDLSSRQTTMTFENGGLTRIKHNTNLKTFKKDELLATSL